MLRPRTDTERRHTSLHQPLTLQQVLSPGIRPSGTGKEERSSPAPVLVSSDG